MGPKGIGWIIALLFMIVTILLFGAGTIKTIALYSLVLLVVYYAVAVTIYVFYKEFRVSSSVIAFWALLVLVAYLLYGYITNDQSVRTLTNKLIAMF